MHIKALVTAVVRQTALLLAQLATAAGARAPLADVADQLFLELARELEAQGVGKKVASDMFGLVLRSYQKKLQRLAGSPAASGHSLWEAVLGHVRTRGRVSRAELLHRFRRDDEALVRAVAADLVRTGFLLQSGKSEDIHYEVSPAAESGAMEGLSDTAGTDALVWQAIYMYGPLPLSRLVALVPLEASAIHAAVARLTADERVEHTGALDPQLATRELTIPPGARAGWEAAVFDHFQALVSTLTMRLQALKAPEARVDAGGSTYTFDVWQGHPREDEVKSLLGAHREILSRLRAEVDDYNRTHVRPADFQRISFYLGQHARDLRSLEG